MSESADAADLTLESIPKQWHGFLLAVAHEQSSHKVFARYGQAAAKFISAELCEAVAASDGEQAERILAWVPEAYRGGTRLFPGAQFPELTGIERVLAFQRFRGFSGPEAALVFLAAVVRMKNAAYDLYVNLSNSVDDEKTKRLWERLATEELQDLGSLAAVAHDLEDDLMPRGGSVAAAESAAGGHASTEVIMKFAELSRSGGRKDVAQGFDRTMLTSPWKFQNLEAASGDDLEASEAAVSDLKARQAEAAAKADAEANAKEAPEEGGGSASRAPPAGDGKG